MKLHLQVGMTIYTMRQGVVCVLNIHTIQKIGRHEYVRCIDIRSQKQVTFVNCDDASDKYFYNISGVIDLMKDSYKKY